MHGPFGSISSHSALSLSPSGCCTFRTNLTQVLAVKQDLAKIMLTAPVCTCEGEKIALSRRVDKHWRLIGWGEIRRGSKIDCDESN